MIAAPPVEPGAVQETTDWPFAFDVALTDVGAPGTVEGVAEAEAVEAEPVPDAFVAVTVNVYAVPLVRPVIVHGFTNRHDTGVCAVVEMNGVTAYPVIAAPPVLPGAVHETTD